MINMYKRMVENMRPLYMLPNIYDYNIQSLNETLHDDVKQLLSDDDRNIIVEFRYLAGVLSFEVSDEFCINIIRHWLESDKSADAIDQGFYLACKLDDIEESDQPELKWLFQESVDRVMRKSEYRRFFH